MEIDLVEVASYMPPQSSFSVFVRNLYGLTELPVYKPSIQFLVKKLPSSERDYMTMAKAPTDSEATPEVKENLIEKAAKNEIVATALNRSANKISTFDKHDPNYYFWVNKVIIEERKIVQSGGLKKFFCNFLCTTVAGLAVAYAAPCMDSTGSLEESNFSTYYVQTAHGNLNIRTTPQLLEDNSNVILSSPSGTVVRVIAEDGDFYELECADIGLSDSFERCFAHKDYLKAVFPKIRRS